jgi:hypothetical protein
MKERIKIKKGEDKSGMASSLIVRPVRKPRYEVGISRIQNLNTFQQRQRSSPIFSKG